MNRLSIVMLSLILISIPLLANATMNVTFQGNPLTVKGKQLKVGDKAPDFITTKGDLSPYSLKETNGVKIISVLPSLDTSVCQVQTKRFNEEIKNTQNISLIAISMDLPFAQERFCTAQNIKNSLVVSDYKDRDFAKKYALLIDELKLLTRAVLVLDKDNIVRYVEYPVEITNEPNYNAALKVAKSLVKGK